MKVTGSVLFEVDTQFLYKIQVNVKVKFTLEQAKRLRSGVEV